MALELSDEMYERLIALITEALISADACQREVALLRQEHERDYRELSQSAKNVVAGNQMLNEGFKAVEEDLTEVQSALREHSAEFKEVKLAFQEQALATEAMAREINSLATAVDGITQLTKSNFDQLESLRQQVIDGEDSGRIGHGEKASGRSQ